MYAYIPAKDMQRARQFYEQKLGFKPKQDISPGMKTEVGIATAGGAKAAWFKDTEGNIMAVIQTP
jgi:predicted enzyme related to lactoylglutathione lyase